MKRKQFLRFQPLAYLVQGPFARSSLPCAAEPLTTRSRRNQPSGHLHDQRWRHALPKTLNSARHMPLRSPRHSWSRVLCPGTSRQGPARVPGHRVSDHPIHQTHLCQAPAAHPCRSRGHRSSESFCSWPGILFWVLIIRILLFRVL